MNKNFSGCISCQDGCDNPCNSPCGPASYRCDFDITASPFDPSTWNVTWCGKLHKIKIPAIAETDTTLSTNYSNATLNYKAERHEDIITGEQLGSLIAVGDLRDTEVDYTTEALCYELIYHKYGDCGDGCMSVEDRWSTFSIDNDGALGPQIRYVRGANRYGCPYFLDVPPNPAQFWFQGWRTENNENGYYQAVRVEELPKDSNGNYVVLSQYYQNKQPVVGIIPWQCMLENIFGNLGMQVTGDWRPSQGTAGFGDDLKFDQINGYFSINWNDWNDLAETQLAGKGVISGKLNWEMSFNPDNGVLKYVINSVYYDKMTWTPVQGVTQPSAPTMYAWAIDINTNAETEIIPGQTFGRAAVTYTINKTFPANKTIMVGPGQEVESLDFIHIRVDWANDDEGILGALFSSKLSGWKDCPPGTGF